MKDNSLYICNSCNQVMLTRQQIADFTGLRVETVIRVIRILHEKKLLAIQKGKVFYTNMTPIIVEV
jgi:CRP-like cAMP-binding protein